MSEPLNIPVSALSEEALSGIIDEFIMREGTDYGEVELSHTQKVAQIRRLLNSGEVRISFDPITESCTLTEA